MRDDLIERLRSVKWEVIDDDDWDSRCVFEALLNEAVAALEAARKDAARGEGDAWCAECGVKLENVRPGKHQHPICSQAAPQQPAESAEPVAWVAADTLNSPHPACVSSLAYMSQLDRERGREYVPLYAAPVAAQTADDNDVVYLWDSAPPIPRWVIDSADRIAKYMDANWPGEWALGRIQSRAAQKADDARDAERYRWLRDREIPEWLDLWHQNPDRIDAAIDQARGEGVA